MVKDSKYKAIVIGASAGGLMALTIILGELPVNYSLPIIVVQHRNNDQKHLLEEILQKKCKIKIKQVDEKEKIQKGIVYIAPPDYHLLIERDKTFSLSSGRYVHCSRPSIDELFESASVAYQNELIGIILTGANKDGASGIRTIHASGGLTIAQNPIEAEFPIMPSASIETKSVQHIKTLLEIQEFLLNIG